MDNIAGKKSGLSWAVNISVALLVMLWVFPTAGLFVSSFRTADQISSNGWWQSLFNTEYTISKFWSSDFVHQTAWTWGTNGPSDWLRRYVIFRFLWNNQ